MLWVSVSGIIQRKLRAVHQTMRLALYFESGLISTIPRSHLQGLIDIQALGLFR